MKKSAVFTLSVLSSSPIYLTLMRACRRKSEQPLYVPTYLVRVEHVLTRRVIGPEAYVESGYMVNSLAISAVRLEYALDFLLS